MATLSTRQRKDYGIVPEQLVGEWRERAARLGFDRAACCRADRRAYRRDRTVAAKRSVLIDGHSAEYGQRPVHDQHSAGNDMARRR